MKHDNSLKPKSQTPNASNDPPRLEQIQKGRQIRNCKAIFFDFLTYNLLIYAYSVLLVPKAS